MHSDDSPIPRDRSVAFDRAADIYDQTRVQPPEVMAHIVETVVAELRDGVRCLEIGVGTGRIALPLFERGISMVGIDLSAPMLAKLVDKAGGVPLFPLIRADATRLPFRDGDFDAAIAVWVLHLIPDWKLALVEIARVIRPGGVLMVDAAGWNEPRHEIQTRFLAEADAPREHRGVWKREHIDEHMRSLGAHVRMLPGIRQSGGYPPRKLIKDLEEGVFSITWDIPQEVRSRAAERVRRWASDKWGSLDADVDDEWTIEWRAYDL